MKLNYRRAITDDADLLIELYNNSFYQDFLRYGECPAYGRTKERMQQSIIMFPKDIISCDDIPVGAISVDDKGNGEYYLGCLCVIPEYQNKGIGTQAIKHLLESHTDWKRISLITPYDKDENIYFYTQKCGFKIDGIELDGNVKVVRLILERKVSSKCVRA
jgi:ribosomal protein S18 acetylase RimI-like enzyme